MSYGALHHIEHYVDDLIKTIDFLEKFLSECGYRTYQKFTDGHSFIHKDTYIVFVKTDDKHRKAENNRQGARLNHISFLGGTKEKVEVIRNVKKVV